MSFILDALRRAQRERQVGHAPDLAAVYREPRPTRRSRWPWWLAAGLVLVNAGGLIALLVVRPWSGPAPATPSAPMAAGTPAPGPSVGEVPEPLAPVFRSSGAKAFPGASESPARPAPGSESVEEAAPPHVEPPSLASRGDEPAAPPPASVESASAPAAGEGETPEAVQPPTQPVASAPQAAAAQPSPSTTPAEEAVSAAPTPSPPPPGATAAPEEPLASPPEDAPAPPVQKEVPWLSELPPAVQQRLPDLRIDAHVYSDDPAKRFVFMGSRSYHEGDRIGEDGPKIVEIVPDGLIIDYGGGRARVPISR